MMLKKLILFFVLFAAQAGAQVSHAKWTLESRKVSDCEYDLLFRVDIDKHYHIFSIIRSGDVFPTSFTFAPSQDYVLQGKMKETKPHVTNDDIMGKLLEHYEKVTFTQRIKLLSDKKVTIKGLYEHQICDTVACQFLPVEEFQFDLTGHSSCKGSAADSFGMSTSSNVCVCDTAAILTTAKPASDTTMNMGSDLPVVAQGADVVDIDNLSWWFIFLQGCVAGFAALLTPCVFPMIPMNVSFFTKQSKTRRQGLRNALLYAVFLIVLYVGLGLGVTLVFGAGALHSMSTNVWFNLAFFVLLLVFAASFLGAFEIVLPSAFVNKMDARADKGGIGGIFFMAFTLALVSFSCTGPIVGTLLVQAATTGNLSDPFWGMFGFSLALSLPFGLFAAFPGWLNSLPKSGGWLNSVKVVLGFLELALALKFASNADLVVQAGILTREVFIGLWIVIFGLQTIYLMGGFKTAHDSDVKHVSVTRMFFIIASFFVTVYLIPGLWGAPLKLFSGILPPLEYSESPHGFGGTSSNRMPATTDPEFAGLLEENKNGIIHFKNNYDLALKYARKVNKPLMVDFTGHACANCRKTEDYVWPDPEIKRRLNENVVLVSLYVDDKRPLKPEEYMKVQWYGKERTIRDIGDKFKYMEEKTYGQSTQPLYVLLDHNEKLLNRVRGYDPDIAAYGRWMDEGIQAFEKTKR